MQNNDPDLGIFISSYHNTNSVIEVYFDPFKKEINEIKCLSSNRYKKYNYKLEEYQTQIKKFSLVIPK